MVVEYLLGGIRTRMSYRCPKCNGIIYNRRNNVCGFCGAELPASLLFTPSEIAALDEVAKETDQDNDHDHPVEPSSDKLVASLRDCICGLILLAMVVYLVYSAVSATRLMRLIGTLSQEWREGLEINHALLEAKNISAPIQCGILCHADAVGFAPLARPACPLLCDFENGVLLLRGLLKSFHHKQLAQETVRRLIRVRQIINTIEVTDRTEER